MICQHSYQATTSSLVSIVNKKDSKCGPQKMYNQSNNKRSHIVLYKHNSKYDREYIYYSQAKPIDHHKFCYFFSCVHCANQSKAPSLNEWHQREQTIERSHYNQ